MDESLSRYLAEIDAEALAGAYRKASPTRFFVVDGFLEPAFAREVAAAYPSFSEARSASGAKEFARVNEDVKVQVTDAARFPEPVRILHELLASDPFLAWMTRVTGIPELQADPDLSGGGMHVMRSRAVHAEQRGDVDRHVHRFLRSRVVHSGATGVGDVRHGDHDQGGVRGRGQHAGAGRRDGV